MSDLTMDPSMFRICALEGHVPLNLEGSNDVNYLPLTHTPTGRQFGRMKFCTRCQAVYWEPELNGPVRRETDA